jgi:hypothetical protein
MEYYKLKPLSYDNLMEVEGGIVLLTTANILLSIYLVNNWDEVTEGFNAGYNGE